MIELTYQEKKVLNILAYAWDEFTLLPEQHSDDAQEFRAATHALQNMILARPMVRVLKETEE